MKKLSLILSVAILLSFVSCSSDSGKKSETDAPEKQTEGIATQSTDTEKRSSELTLSELVENAKKAGQLDDLTFIPDTDEYAEDMLTFSYGLSEEMVSMMSEYIVSEKSSKGANSLAYFRFKDKTDKDAVESVKEAIEETYITELKASLKMYNPEAYALCDKAFFKTYDGALLFVICEDNVRDSIVSVFEK